MFCDAYGVLNDGTSIYPEANDAVALLKSRCATYLLTNDAGSPLSKLASRWQGVFEDHEILSSGRVYAESLLDSKPQNIVCFATEASLPIFSDCAHHSFQTTSSYREKILESPNDEQTSVDQLVFLSCLGMNWQLELNTSVEILRKNPNCKLVSPNPDKLYSIDNERRGIAVGAVAGLVELTSGKSVEWYGKPEAKIYHYGFEAAKCRIPDLKPEECLMIGDTLETDIAGAEAAGWDSLLILKGISGRQDSAKIEKLNRLRATANRLSPDEPVHLV